MKLRQLGTNQTEVEVSEGLTVFFRYQTPVACQVHGRVQTIKKSRTGGMVKVPHADGYYRTSRKWSVTTSKHINKWLDGVEAVEAKEMDQSFFDELVQS